MQKVKVWQSGKPSKIASKLPQHASPLQKPGFDAFSSLLNNIKGSHICVCVGGGGTRRSPNSPPPKPLQAPPPPPPLKKSLRIHPCRYRPQSDVSLMLPFFIDGSSLRAPYPVIACPNFSSLSWARPVT